MDVSSHPVEGRRADRFRPPHCPRRDCPDHLAPKRYRARRVGGYCIADAPRLRIPRFRCPSCKSTFSLRAFSCLYYMKRPELLIPVAKGLVAGSAHRQIARSLSCAPSTVTRIAARIGRHAQLLQALCLQELKEQEPQEPVVLDHFETFVFSQEDRLAIGTAVGQNSWFCYTMDPAPHRRGGPRSARKRALRRPLTPPEPESMVQSTRRVLELIRSVFKPPVKLVTDDAPAYKQADADAETTPAIVRRVYANPPRGPGSDRTLALERDRQMFAVDLMHKLLRHSQAHHRRETIAFGRRLNAVVERAYLFAVWRNLVKGRSERDQKSETPAMALGLTSKRLSWIEVFSQRLFPARIELPQGWMKVYRREWVTPAVGRNLQHDLIHAF